MSTMRAVMRPHLLARLASGAALALVSDAGTPLVSDPGYKLVADALAESIEVISVPGASAVLAALVVAGLPTDRFFFEGFLPPKSRPRRAAHRRTRARFRARWCFSNRRAASRTCSLIWPPFSAPRDAALARELTKYLRDCAARPLAELAAALGRRRAAERRDRRAGRSARRRGARAIAEEIDARLDDGAGDAFGQGRRRRRFRRDRPAAPQSLCAGDRADRLVRFARLRALAWPGATADERRAAHGHGIIAERVAILRAAAEILFASLRAAIAFAAAKSISWRGAATPSPSSKSRSGQVSTRRAPPSRRQNAGASRARRGSGSRRTLMRRALRCAATRSSSRRGAGQGMCRRRSSWRIFRLKNILRGQLALALIRPDAIHSSARTRRDKERRRVVGLVRRGDFDAEMRVAPADAPGVRHRRGPYRRARRGDQRRSARPDHSG